VKPAHVRERNGLHARASPRTDGVAGPQEFGCTAALTKQATAEKREEARRSRESTKTTNTMKEPRKTPKPKAPREPAQSPPPYRLDDALESVHAPTPLDGLVIGGTPASESCSRACDAEDFEEQPETVIDQIARLPKRWMQRYAAALFKVGGIASLARKAIRPECGGISIDSVRKAAANCPEFAGLIAAAQLDGQQTVDAAVYTGATVGDDVPVYQQGEYIATKKVRSDKAAELFYKKNGLMADQNVNVLHTGRIELVDESQMADMLREVALLLHGQPKQATGRVVSEREREA
jgi:hypothetical protein